MYGGGGGALEPEQFEVSQRTTLCQHETFVYKIIDLFYFTSYMSCSFLLTICLRTEHAPIQLHSSSPLSLLLLCLDFPCPGSLISLLQVELVHEVFRRVSQDLPLHAQVQDVDALVALGLDAVVPNREDVVGRSSELFAQLLNLIVELNGRHAIFWEQIPFEAQACY